MAFSQTRRIITLAILGSLAGLCESQAQPSGISAGEKIAWSIVDQVVRITTTKANGAADQEGFGLVFGERDGTVYVVTADHVVRHEQDDGSPGEAQNAQHEKIQVIFHNDQGHRYVAELLDLQLPHEKGDLAVLDLPRPKSFTFVPAPVASADALVAGTRAWRIGKLEHWVPASNPGQFVDRGALWLTFDDLDAPRGSSGGPVVTEDGVVGIIVEDGGMSGIPTSVLPMGTIAAVLQDWQLPWNLRPKQLVPEIPKPAQSGKPPTPSNPGNSAEPSANAFPLSAAADAEMALNLSSEDRRAVQHALNQLGYPAGNDRL